MKPPPTYKGSESENFRSWWRQVERYLDYHLEEIPTDRHKIRWTTALLGDFALRWYEDREDRLEHLHMTETWEGFSTAMREHFVNPHEIKEDLAKMEKMAYANNIDDYIIKMDALNNRIGFKGVPWHQFLKKGLPAEILDRMAYGSVEPSETSQFIERLRGAGKRYEERRQQHQHPKKDAPKPSTSSADAPSSSKSSKSSKARRREKATEKTATAESSEKPEWRDREEWLKGIPDTLRKSRAEKELCLRCGKPGHKWFTCSGKIVISGARKRRKVEDRKEEVKKEVKVGAVEARISAPSAGRIYEPDSEEE